MPSTLELVRRFIDEAWNRGELGVIREIMTAPYQATFLNAASPPSGPQSYEQLEQHVREFRDAFPDLHMELEDALESGDRAYVQTRLTGTQDGPYMGMPPSGRKLNIVLAAIYDKQGDRLVGHRVLVDGAGMLQQLGMAPVPPAGGPPGTPPQ